ncbi:MAG: pseudouridine synthase [Bdellovibrio sp. ArHS]|uniref:pseudouridine synthase n=1 Tax=Bdellovibrio sp. ArHS TaxID=1569284 RepID=UPI00058306F4|nr:RNA pseudouridine synthase [Bdellovibrio sp. ArHS]KHD87519.1 MAG: pseudouridine synthase [Bdellovibrio sp. ArHS]
MIQIVFENENFVVCDKPSGVLTTPSRYEAEDNRMCLGVELQNQLRQQIFPIHRLDFEVSGLVLFAKNANAHKKGNVWFELKQVQKTYRAVTCNQRFDHIPESVPNKREFFALKEGQTFEWRSRLLRGKRRAYESPQGKPSLTTAVFLEKNNQDLVWDLNPVTGRAHQLRFELSRHGFPIHGDSLYGSCIDCGANKISLRSYKVDFTRAPGAEALGLPPVIAVSAAP